VPLHIRNYRELTREFLSGKILALNQKVEDVDYGRISARITK
jgi:hypothetical protein